MKSQLLSIFSGATESGSAPEPTTESETGFSRYHARYQQFLNRQTYDDQPRSYRTAAPVRFFQGLFSFAVFVAMFLAILTLVGFGLSNLGIIAQVTPSTVSASGKTSGSVNDSSPAPVLPKKKSQRR